MRVSVEALTGLERKLTVSIPSEKIEEKVQSRLQELCKTVKVNGFMPGKVPLEIVKKRFSSAVYQEIAQDLMRESLPEAIKNNRDSDGKELVPAGTPHVELGEIKPNEDFTYTAVFEVFPEIKFNEIQDVEVENHSAAVNDSDVDSMISKFQEQNKIWHDVDRAVANGDKVRIDFAGFIDNEPFQGGESKDHELVIGSKSMIPGFEEGLVGHKVGEAYDINVTFPEDYHHQPLAGKNARFAITIHQVQEGKLPELDDEFAKKFGIKEGGMDALRKDIRQNMERELETRVMGMNRQNVFDKFMKANPIDLPKALIDQEIENLKHEMYHQIFGHEHRHDEKIPDFPRELFEDRAHQRVHLGLLFAEYVRHHKMEAEPERVDAMIERLASAYEQPDELRNWYRSDKRHLAELESYVMEEMVAEKMRSVATVIEKASSYDEIMNPKTQAEGQGE